MYFILLYCMELLGEKPTGPGESIVLGASLPSCNTKAVVRGDGGGGGGGGGLKLPPPPPPPPPTQILVQHIVYKRIHVDVIVRARGTTN